MRNFACYLFVAIALLLCDNAQSAQNVASPDKKIVYLDPGHGGRRPGKSIADPDNPKAIIKEKDLNLNIAKKVKELIASKDEDIVVYLCREDDIDLREKVEDDNQSRALDANKKEADLYISIHCNSADDTSAQGVLVLVLDLGGNVQTKNESQASRFVEQGEFITLSAEDKRQAGYITARSRQANNDPFARMCGEFIGKRALKAGRNFQNVQARPTVWTVLYYSKCPSLIVECGYMSNKSELRYLKSEKGQNEMASIIGESIIEYFDVLDKMRAATDQSGDTGEQTNSTSQNESKSGAGTVAKESAPKSDGVANNTTSSKLKSGYTIQLLSSTKAVDENDSQFKAYRGKVMLKMGTGSYKYKYCYGTYATASEAKEELAKVRTYFKDAYVVRFEGDNIKSK